MANRLILKCNWHLFINSFNISTKPTDSSSPSMKYKDVHGMAPTYPLQPLTPLSVLRVMLSWCRSTISFQYHPWTRERRVSVLSSAFQRAHFWYSLVFLKGQFSMWLRGNTHFESILPHCGPYYGYLVSQIPWTNGPKPLSVCRGLFPRVYVLKDRSWCWVGLRWAGQEEC